MTDIEQTTTDEISLDEIVTILRGRGIPAFVEQTGGGCATLFASHKADENGGPAVNAEGRYDIAVGPGWFTGPGWSGGVISPAEVYVGPDDDGEGTPVTPDDLSVAGIADAVGAALGARFAAAIVIEDLDADCAANGWRPRSFTDLQGLCDANEYLIDAEGYYPAPALSGDAVFDFLNAVSEILDAHLRAKAEVDPGGSPCGDCGEPVDDAGQCFGPCAADEATV